MSTSSSLSSSEDENPFIVENVPQREYSLSKPPNYTNNDRFISSISQKQRIAYQQDCRFRQSLPATPNKSVFHPILTPPHTVKKQNEWDRLMKSKSIKSSMVEPKKKRRLLSSAADAVLDAPNARDDYYGQTLDWSIQGIIAIGLGNECFIWNETGLLENIFQAELPDYINCLRFSPLGKKILIGTEAGIPKVYDMAASTFESYSLPHGLSAGCWNSENEFCTGNATGNIYIWDRRNNNPRSILGYHPDRVVGMASSNDGKFASGDNEMNVYIWDQRRIDRPLLSIRSHTSAVKAISWCPWQDNILATGGGLGDGSICIHSTATGEMLKSAQADNQVCDIVWSEHHREFLSAQLSTENRQMTIWSYPSLLALNHLDGHNSRVTNLALSPDGQRVASIGDDETLKVYSSLTRFGNALKQMG